jgi:alpha-N-arabinofuranosidase
MKARDPRIKIIAVGNPGRWNDVVFPACAPQMDLLSGHHYTERRLRLPFSPQDGEAYARNFLAYSASVANGVKGLVTDFRKRLGQGRPELDRVRLAVDEWGLVRDWNSAPDGPGVGAFEHYYCLGDAVMLGRGLHELLRSVDVVALANWAQTVNVIGTIKAGRNFAALDPAGHLLALYRQHLRGNLLPAQISGEAPLDVVAAREGKNGRLVVGLINYSPNRDIALDLGLPMSGARWRIHGPSLGAINVPGQPEAVTTTVLKGASASQRQITLPAASITLLWLTPNR